MKKHILLACAGILCGCAGTVLNARAPAAWNAAIFLAGEEEAAGPDDFEKPRKVELKKEEPKKEEATPRARTGRFGARAGVLFFASADEREVPPAFFVGGTYSFPLGEESPFALELGVDDAPAVESEDGYISGLVFLRGGMRWTFGDRVRGCIAGGVSGVFEKTESDTLDGPAQNYVMLIDLGAGLWGGRWDVRGGYSIVVGGSNASGVAQVTAGVSF